MDQQLDVAILIDVLKNRIAVLEYELALATALVQQKNKEFEALIDQGKGEVSSLEHRS